MSKRKAAKSRSTTSAGRSRKGAKTKASAKPRRKLCSQPVVRRPAFSPTVSANRASFILTVGKKWLNGTDVTYTFVEGAAKQHAVVRKAFAKWKSLGIGLVFSEVASAEDALLRIGFDHSDGSWSYVGRDNLEIPKSERTMNFGWDLTKDSYGMTTALHEIGHALGFEHEHQSPFAGIEWNEEAVYESFSGPPNNWTDSEIRSNILEKMPPNELDGSKWDPQSIMEYEFEPGLVRKPKPYDEEGIYPPGVLSKLDIKGVTRIYPAKSKSKTVKLSVNESAPISAAAGEQREYEFTAPSTRKYTVQTAGDLDTVVVVSEKIGKKLHYLSGDDDSGKEGNARIRLPLVKGRKYSIKVRVIYAPHADAGSVIVV